MQQNRVYNTLFTSLGQLNKCVEMKKEIVFDLTNFLVTLLVFILPVYFAYLGFPLEIQILPSTLLVVPIVITLYKRRLEVEKIERQRIVNKARKLQPLLVKLERFQDIHRIASSLTYNKQFADDENAFLGWRRYFDRYGNHVNDEFSHYDYDFGWFISQTSRHTEEELQLKLLGFYFLVRSFRHLYDDLVMMIELAGKIPKDQIKNIQELEENYEDFLNALRDLCDEDEEIGKMFKGKYPLVKPHKKLLNIHS